MSVTNAASGNWQPNWATHPGDHIAEHIEANGWTQAEFARLAGLSPKLVSTIINKSNPVTPETAIRLERVLGVNAHVWTNLQAEWDLHEARIQEAVGSRDAESWLAEFPIREIKKRCGLPEKTETSELLDFVLSLLGIGNPLALISKINSLAVHHRRAASRVPSDVHVLTWLMLGEWRAKDIDLPAFDADRFYSALQTIRLLTTEDPEIFEPIMREECRRSGVALVFEKPLPKICLYGSARWMGSERAIIQMSLRMKSNDHFWWTFFHEAGHIMLHRGKNFADDQGATGDGPESEADAFAEDILVGRERLRAFLEQKPHSASRVREFASSLNIHPGIIVGMLQHRGVVPYSQLNGLKVKFAWTDEVKAS